ncbi:MAG: YeeE/YedE family protein [Granulosicoccus sp.]|nr:YeeE/YedE family protein [Granulosicoccus sp.]
MQTTPSTNSGLPVALMAWLAGVIFGVGLLVSGMANPAKVLNFLDVLGSWDPSLAFVMGGAVLTTMVGYPLISRRSSPRLAPRFQMPVRSDIDRPLVSGAALFGLGWGIGGFCPGPAWTSLSGLAPGALVFLVAMLTGMWLAIRRSRKRLQAQTA